MSSLVIRPALKAEAGFLTPLVDAASEGLAPYVWAQLAAPDQTAYEHGQARIESEDAGISYRNAWVAERGGEPCGCLLAYRQPDTADPIDPDMPAMFRPLLELENEATETGYVYVLSTVASMRGQGIGSKLLEFGERYRGPRGMSLIVADNNTRARALYERHGYRAAATRPMVKNGWQSDGKNWVLMIKP